ncbi:uncharacterized protein LOC112083468 [Eutrema salsugineum]|uniref:uncharacterized protein LOC112083468 n=1 Tax=Eutrema salsugineum TaxID=72664 RepID=UPI000CED1A75|nr:uncharacterized protein LOC112083468 [Eutrema salsugineum]
MSQSGLIKHDGTGKKVEISMKRLKVTVPHFDNSSLIEAYSKTLIRRCMNPHMQDMKALLYMLPRIWKVEDRVAGADLGLGRFQFDFDPEEDIMEVLKMEPFHFDYWMLSLVRWAPAVNPTYPSAIMFWVRIVGVLLHFWADVTFESIGKALGDVKKVNLDEGNVQIDGGVETTVYLRYERLFGFYKFCHSLCHDQQRFPSRPDSTERKVKEDYNDEHRNGQGAASYKAATVHGNVGNK